MPRTRKSLKVVTLAGLGMLAGSLALLVVRSGGPTYEGKPSSYWERRFPEEGAEEALQAMGSNSVPFLINALRARSSPVSQAYESVRQRLPSMLADRLPAPTFDPELCRAHAATTLSRIGPDAVAAVPALCAALNDPFHGVRNNAIVALGKIAPKTAEAPRAIAALMPATGDTNDIARANAYSSLGQFAPEATEIIPLLRRGLSDPSRSVRLSALRVLGRFSSVASDLVGEITRCLEDQDKLVRYAATNALQAILAPQPSTVP